MIIDLQSRVAHHVRRIVAEMFGVQMEAVAFQYPPRLELGDLALTVPFELAKTLRRNPREIARDLAGRLGSLPDVARAETAGGGYVNIFLDRRAFALELHRGLIEPRSAALTNGRVIVEHTSINPNKAAHIGHLRNAVLGDTFVRVLRHRGYTVGVQNYIDDTGVQVADIVVGFIHIERKSLDEVAAISGRFDHYCWDLYARVGDFYAQDLARRELQSEALHAIEAGDNETARLAAHVAARIVECHLATMARLDVHYDLLVLESDILRLRFWERAFARLKESGALWHEQEGKNAGCWVLSMEEGGHDEDKIIVRSNGTVTYTGKDIAYQLWKLGLLDRDFRYRRHARKTRGGDLWTTTSGEGDADAPAFGHARAVYNVIDVGQSYPQRVVKAGVAALGHAAAALSSRHLAYEKVVLSPATARALGYDVSDGETSVKVSGRKGLGVKADDLIDALVAKAREEVDARDPARDSRARESAATEIAVGALRYFMLKFSRAKIIVFDMDEALAFVGETGPYIQNAIVRARNIFVKLEAQGASVEDLIARARALDLERFLAGEEGDLAFALLMLVARSEDVAQQAIDSGGDATLLAKHAFLIAQAFHSYYQKPQHSLLRAENDDVRAFRVLVVDIFVRQMTILADLLGIPVPERM
ncbi:MAG: arginine--tRNA ligase [Vicinamibacteria bacterium]|nr:arginine--tRNA ligase [Vicinamibacteria bacterium]